jgi:hypothetical protein
VGVNAGVGSRPPSPIRGTSFNFSFARGGRLRNELYIDSGDQEENDHIFQAIASQRQELEASYGRPLEFEALEDKRAARIADYRDGDVVDEDSYEQFIDWFIDSGRRLRRSLSQIELTGVG